MMWRRVLTVIAVVLLLAGVGFLLFPTVSNFIGQQRADAVIEGYADTLEHVIPATGDAPDSPGVTAKTFEEAVEKGEIDAEGYPVDAEGRRTADYTVTFQADLDRLLRDSREYNAGLVHHQGGVDTINYADAALDLSRYGIFNNLYGYLSAPSIDMSLPVYLGANDYVMSFGAAHLNGTSLPLDENNTNVAIAGHTGYIGRIFFDDIRGLRVGDTVSFTNYWETIDYEVIGFKSVAPNETGDIYIQDGRRLLTLITCTPDGKGGFGRYLVICEKT